MKKSLLVLLSFLVSGVVFGISPAKAANEVANRDALRTRLGLDAYTGAGALDSLKIAILDNGFQGYQPGAGLLPASTELVEGKVDPEAATAHGIEMAEIVWAMTGMLPTGPKFYLINTNGYSNLQSAVQFVIQEKVDIVLYSEVWPFGSNFDGQGFINNLVNQATTAGILWINAAGNFGGAAYNGTVDSQTSAGQFLSLGKSGYLEFENKLDQNTVTITLSWTDFKDTDTYNAVKDLDLFIYDSSNNQIGASALIQKGEAPPTDGSASPLSSFARESVTLTNLNRGTYRIKVRKQSENFEDTDRFRVILDVAKPDSVTFTDHSTGGEIMPPADNPNVFTVGEDTQFSSVGPTADGRTKPDIKIQDAGISFTNGEQTDGSSNAAALIAGVAVLMKATCGNLSFDSLEKYATTLRNTSNDSDIRPADPRLINQVILSWVPKGGQIDVQLNGHLVILSPTDPLDLPIFKNQGAYRLHPDDVMVINAVDGSWHGVPKISAPMIEPPLVEFRQMSTGMWQTPTPEQACSL
jgi:hypothetical protein